MKKITPLAIDDIKILEEIAEKKAAKSYPLINSHNLIIVNQYKNYEKIKGDPNLYKHEFFDYQLLEAMKSHYDSDFSCLDFIELIRNKLSSDVCPMCGSMGTGTVDHYLPKADFEEYSFFSKNLIPACLCNSKRGVALKDTNSQARILHPYYDSCLSERLVSCLIQGEFENPSIEIIPILNDVNDENNLNIKFHIKYIIKKTIILEWLGEKWSKLSRRPAIMIRSLPDTVITIEILQQEIEKNILEKDDEFNTPNNWYSIFYHGILNSPGVLNWILDRHNDIVRSRIR